LASVEKLARPAMAPKPIHSLLVQKSGDTLPKAQTPQTIDYPQSSDSKRAESPLRDTVICRMDNKVGKTMTVPFLYTDLSKIEESYCQTYEGESKMNGIRHGFGTQYYTNGEKFTGFFE
jgi:hypothetical protein